MARLLLEIGTEEMPARFLGVLEEHLRQTLDKFLADKQLIHGAVEAFSTPRRLVVTVPEVSETQPVSEELVTGPPARVALDAQGKPTKAAEGFARTHGVDLTATYVQQTERGDYLAARKKVGGARTLDILPDMLLAIIAGLPFPKRMRWGDKDFAFGRPIRWLLALLDDKVIDFGLAGLESGRLTWGHRVHGFGPFEVAKASDYLDVVREKCRVVVSGAERRAAIRQQADALAVKAGGRGVWNDKRLEEGSGLVELPKVIRGRFDPSYLEVPREALISCMESHQKCFGVEDASGALMPYFIATLNLEPRDLELVRKGWERVLKARLEDARFFWKTDMAHELGDWLARLENVVFMWPLGSMGDKARRIEKLAGCLARKVCPEIGSEAARAGLLAKADLVSEMVGEFADLQGLMGGIYARKKGESETVAKAIYEHYLPAGPDSPTPQALAGALVSMADKADTLAGCFGLGKVPTGANDPYALRRGALGICRIILAHGLRIDLRSFLHQAIDGYGQIQWSQPAEETLSKRMDCCAQRLRSYFATENEGREGYPTLAIEAAVSAGIEDIYALKFRLEALADFTREPDFEQAVLTFKRAGNIIFKQGQVAGALLTGEYSAVAFQEPQEKALAQALEQMIPRFETLWAEDRFAELLGLLRELRPTVDAFFDNVMGMCEDVRLRENRLNLLFALVSRLGRLADFSALQI